MIIQMLRKSEITEPPESKVKVGSLVSGRLNKSIVAEETQKKKKTTKKQKEETKVEQENKKPQSTRAKSVNPKTITEVEEEEEKKPKGRSASVNKETKPTKKTTGGAKTQSAHNKTVSVKVEYCNT